MAKLMPNSAPQNFTMSRQTVRPVVTYTLSMIASSTDRPSVSGTNRKWYIAVRPNCRRDSETTSMSGSYGSADPPATRVATSIAGRCAGEKNSA